MTNPFNKSVELRRESNRLALCAKWAWWFMWLTMGYCLSSAALLVQHWWRDEAYSSGWLIGGLWAWAMAWCLHWYWRNEARHALAQAALLMTRPPLFDSNESAEDPLDL